ncbi:hypothetical protein MQM1_013 [Aeromonas phage vB_AsaP_MQM1]|nr:hypothetical protein MQM1_013 [Aeromonas phage vB_AsaP_MQM1]
MPAATHDLKVEQGSTLQFQIEFIKDGKAVNLSDYEFSGEVKNSIYDTSGFPFRFVKSGSVLDVYLDADVSATMDFETGVYDIVTITLDGRASRLLQGAVTIDLGVTL